VEAALTKRLLDTLTAAGDPRVGPDPVFEHPPFTDPNPAAGQRQQRRQARPAVRSAIPEGATP
jgi:hypothetical protein